MLDVKGYLIFFLVIGQALCRTNFLLSSYNDNMLSFFLRTFYPKPDSYINCCCCVARSRISLLTRPIGGREALRHATAVVRSSMPSLRKIETVRSAQELLGAPTIGGGVPVRGWWWMESKKSNKLPSRPECMKTAPKQPFSRTY
jgi:hypothetical protein